MTGLAQAQNLLQQGAIAVADIKPSVLNVANPALAFAEALGQGSLAEVEPLASRLNGIAGEGMVGGLSRRFG